MIVQVTSADSLWELDSDILQPRESKAFTQSFQGYSIVNGVIDIGVELPYVGLFGNNLADYKALGGFADGTNAGGDDFMILGWSDLPNGKLHAVKVNDTTSLDISSRGVMNINALSNIESTSDNNIISTATGLIVMTGQGSVFVVNANGIVIPRISSNTTGEKGAMIYNSTLDVFNAYENDAFYKVITSKTLSVYADAAAADADAALLSGYFYKLTGDRTVYQKP
jgi:hypothetical protein